MAHLYTFILCALFLVILFISPSISEDQDGNTEHLNVKDPKHREIFDQKSDNRQTQPTVQDLTPTKTLKPKDFKLADLTECKDDVAQYCPKDVNRNNNFQVLTCLQDNAKQDDLSDECHIALWHYKYNLTHANIFDTPAKDICKTTFLEFPECEAAVSKVPCMLSKRQNVTDAQCRHFLTKLQSIYFSDHRLVEPFLKACGGDVIKHSCGRIETKDVTVQELHSQGEVIECLEDKIQDLDEGCRNQIFRMAELQSDDYHLDRALFYACRDDREKFCQDVPSGEGKVYKCLMKNKFNDRMTQQCREKLTVRQKIIAKDYKAQYPLMKSCKKDYKLYNCDKGDSPHESLAKLLLCLQEQISLGKPVDPDCQEEIKEASQELMEDYSLNPEVVAGCANEIKNYCENGLRKEGQTLDCLMKIGEEKQHGKSLSEGCEKAITSLLKETGAAADYRIDYTLGIACEPVVNHLCKEHVAGKEGDIMIVSCLMENLYNKDMEIKCRNQLLHLQFFVSRDFRLNPAVYKVCAKDARDVCHAKDWNDEHELPQGMIMSCLYRDSLLDTDSEVKVSDKCASVIKRVMHQRAVDVNLIPEVQEKCLKDLGEHCTDKVEKGEEIACLQERYDDLLPDCQEAVSKFTEEEAEDFELDRSLVKSCGPMVTKFCHDIVQQGQTQAIMPCLISMKNDAGMDFKCKSSIEHWQLLELKDIKFSPLFKEACRKDIKEKCKEVKKKADVLKCLSNAVHDAVMNDKEHMISRKCRIQLKVELLQQTEDIKLDPELYGQCQEDVFKFCNGVPHGDAAVIECLKDHQQELSNQCHIQIFNKEKAESEDRSLDFKFMKVCKTMIKMHCSSYTGPKQILQCLIKVKRDEDMDPNCRRMITKRQKLQYEDIRLNPEMEVNCKKDVSKFCSQELRYTKEGILNEGKIISCLKKHKESLSEDCEFYVRNIERESALDYQLDPELSKDCEQEIKVHCADMVPGKGDVEQCLKDKMKQINNKRCLAQIVRVLRESQTDIFVDPFLYEACLNDKNKHCPDVKHGNGRVMACLLGVYEDAKLKLTQECHKQLKYRANLWAGLRSKEVAIPDVVGLPQLMSVVSTSPSRNYFYIVFLVCLVIIFLGGLLSGRLSKRVRQEFKNR